jgi:pimeloyl-ACP methyl ester carboxylesterase
MELAPALSKTYPEQAKHNSQSKTYEIEGAKINVSWKEFFPTNKDAPQDEAILFLPGWSAGTAKTLRHLSQRFAEDSGTNVLSITTRTEKVIPDSLYEEAKAIRNLIIEKGLKKITIASHSEGGIKAADLIDILQKENQDIDIQGLILLDPVGLYEQNRAKFTVTFIQDITINTVGDLAGNLIKDLLLGHSELVRRDLQATVKGTQALTDVIANIAKEMAKTRITGYPKKIWSQISEMAKTNTHYQDIKCPVVLIQGEKDPVSSPEKVLPEKSESISEGREILKNAFFPNSRHVNLLVGKKIPRHGMYHFRPDSISNASLGLLRRYWRGQRSSDRNVA